MPRGCDEGSHLIGKVEVGYHGKKKHLHKEEDEKGDHHLGKEGIGSLVMMLFVGAMVLQMPLRAMMMLCGRLLVVFMMDVLVFMMLGPWQAKIVQPPSYQRIDNRHRQSDADGVDPFDNVCRELQSHLPGTPNNLFNTGRQIAYQAGMRGTVRCLFVAIHPPPHLGVVDIIMRFRHHVVADK